MERNSGSFDEKAKTWDQPFRVVRAQAVANAIRESILNGLPLKAIEYGCGTGLVSFFLRDLFSSIILVDNSKGMLEVVREKIAHGGATNMEAMDIDAFNTQVKDGRTFNVLFSSMTLHHIPDTRQTLLEWYKCLSFGGHLFVVDLDPENGLFHDEGFEGHNGFDRKALGKVAVEAGFKDVGFKTAHEMHEMGRDGQNHTFTLFFMIAKK